MVSAANKFGDAKIPSKQVSERRSSSKKLIVKKEKKKSGSLLTTNSEKQFQKLSKALDLNQNTVNNREILEHILRSKQMNEEAAKNKQIVDSMKTTMKQIENQLSSRSTNDGKKLQAIPAHSIYSEQQPEYQTGKFFHEQGGSSDPSKSVIIKNSLHNPTQSFASDTAMHKNIYQLNNKTYEVYSHDVK